MPGCASASARNINYVSNNKFQLRAVDGAKRRTRGVLFSRSSAFISKQGHVYNDERNSCEVEARENDQNALLVGWFLFW